MELVGRRFQQTARFWKGVDCEIEIQRPLARNGAPLGLDAEAAHQPEARVVDCCAHIFSAGKHWGGAQLGLSLHVAARCNIHAVRLIRLGFVEETESFIDWLKGRLSDDAERGPLQVMYGIDGRQKLDEITLRPSERI